jgi:flagellar hook-basal body complex protein FliE
MSSPVASGSTTTSSIAATGSAAACAAADALARALTSFKDSLRTGATVEQVRAARDHVVEAYNDLAAAVGDVAKARLEAVKSAADRFDAAVKDIPDGATLTQAVDSLSQEAKDVQAALSDLLTEVHC